MTAFILKLKSDNGGVVSLALLVILRKNESHHAVLHGQIGLELQCKNVSAAEECNHFLAGLFSIS